MEPLYCMDLVGVQYILVSYVHTLVGPVMGRGQVYPFITTMSQMHF